MTARSSLAVAVLVAAACVGALALEEVDEEGAWERLHSGVSFTFDKTPVTEAVKYFQGLGVNVVVQQEVLTEHGDKPVTMKLTNVRIRHALRAFAASIELECEMMEGAIVLLRKPLKDGGESVGKVTLRSGPQTLELAIKRRDLPPETRRHLMHRAVEGFRQETEMRAHGLERRREHMEREEQARRERGEGERDEGERERGERERREHMVRQRERERQHRERTERGREGDREPRERIERGREREKGGDGEPGGVF